MNNFLNLNDELCTLIFSYIHIFDHPNYVSICTQWQRCIRSSKTCERVVIADRSLEEHIAKGLISIFHRLQRIKKLFLVYGSRPYTVNIIKELNIDIKLDQLHLILDRDLGSLDGDELHTVTLQWINMATDLYLRRPNCKIKGLKLHNLKTLTVEAKQYDWSDLPVIDNLENLIIISPSLDQISITQILQKFPNLKTFKCRVLYNTILKDVSIPKNIVKLELTGSLDPSTRSKMTISHRESIVNISLTVQIWNSVGMYNFPELQALKLRDLQSFKLPQTLRKLTLYETQDCDPTAVECLLEREKSQIQYLKIVRNGTREAYPDPEIWKVCQRFNVQRLDLQVTTLYREHLKHAWREFTSKSSDEWRVNYRTMIPVSELSPTNVRYTRIRVIFYRQSANI